VFGDVISLTESSRPTGWRFDCVRPGAGTDDSGEVMQVRILGRAIGSRVTWLYLALTLASALAVHLVFDVADDGFAAVVSRPVHLLYALAVAVVSFLAWRDLARGPRRERRRRLAIARAVVRRSAVSTLPVSCLLQSALAGGTLAIEGGDFGGMRLVLAILASLAAMVAGALVLRHVEQRVLHLVRAVFVMPEERREVRRRRATDVFALAATGSLYFLFVPKRPPPTFA
jgi:hypothetical protein